jgi:hypothetical protein
MICPGTTPITSSDVEHLVDLGIVNIFWLSSALIWMVFCRMDSDDGENLLLT